MSDNRPDKIFHGEDEGRQKKAPSAVVYHSDNIRRKSDTEYFTRVTGARARKRKELARLKKEQREKRKTEANAERKAAAEKRAAEEQERKIKRKIEKEKNGKKRKKAKLVFAILAVITVVVIGVLFLVKTGKRDNSEGDDSQQIDEHDGAILSVDEQSRQFNSDMYEGSFDYGFSNYQAAIDAAQTDYEKAQFYANRAAIMFSIYDDTYSDQIMSDLLSAVALDPNRDYECNVVDYATKLNRIDEYSEYIELCNKETSASDKPVDWSYGSGEG